MTGWIGQTEDHHLPLQDEGYAHLYFWIEFSIRLFHELGCDKLVDLRCHGVFYAGFICQVHKKGVTKVIVVIFIPRLWMKRTIWDKVFLTLGVTFDVVVGRKKVLS